MPAMVEPQMRLGQPCWRLANDQVELLVTVQGGHLGPVTFDRHGKAITPLSVAPWATEPVDKSLPPILQVLRGDFFCLTFGDNASPWRGEKHPVHGETANNPWTLQSAERQGQRRTLHLFQTLAVRPGRVDKYLALQDGHNAVYCRHVISGMSGPVNPGHHAMLKFPDQPACGRITTAPFAYAQVFPHALESEASRGASALRPAARFEQLSAAPLAAGGTTDLSRYPARRGYEDAVQLCADPALRLGWTAVTFPQPGYLWLALKDPQVLTGTVFWFSNGGRHYAPWNGRHINVMGLEEVTSYFNLGLAESAEPNSLTRLGYRTSLTLDPQRPLTVNYIMAVAATPPGFEAVASLKRSNTGVTLVAPSGQQVAVPVDVDWLWGK